MCSSVLRCFNYDVIAHLCTFQMLKDAALDIMQIQLDDAPTGFKRQAAAVNNSRWSNLQPMVLLLCTQIAWVYDFSFAESGMSWLPNFLQRTNFTLSCFRQARNVASPHLSPVGFCSYSYAHETHIHCLIKTILIYLCCSDRSRPPDWWTHEILGLEDVCWRYAQKSMVPNIALQQDLSLPNCQSSSVQCNQFWEQVQSRTWHKLDSHIVLHNFAPKTKVLIGWAITSRLEKSMSCTWTLSFLLASFQTRL